MLIYWIWLATRQHLSDRDKLMLLTHFGSAEACYAAREYPRSLRQESIAALEDKDLTQAKAILEKCRSQKIHILTWEDAAYPQKLKNIFDPPLVLYYRGVLPDFDGEVTIGVVGTRKASLYGLQAAKSFGGQIAACGGLVVSGMAAGIDAMATQGALNQGKPAVGVLGCGVDRVYPSSNRKLYMDVEERGCLISEYPPGAGPDWWHFPKRNRILSGLSCGVLVVEAPEKSGALITARQAMEQGRDVYVVPGNVGVTSSQGSNGLLRDGAMAVLSGWDVLQEYTHQYPGKLFQKEAAYSCDDKKAVDNVASPIYIDLDNEALEDLDEMERNILSRLTGQRLMDDIIAEAGMDPGEALAALTMLEVKGYVLTGPGGWVRKA